MDASYHIHETTIREEDRRRRVEKPTEQNYRCIVFRMLVLRRRRWNQIGVTEGLKWRGRISIGEESSAWLLLRANHKINSISLMVILVLIRNI